MAVRREENGRPQASGAPKKSRFAASSPADRLHDRVLQTFILKSVDEERDAGTIKTNPRRLRQKTSIKNPLADRRGHCCLFFAGLRNDQVPRLTELMQPRSDAFPAFEDGLSGQARPQPSQRFVPLSRPRI